MIKSDMEIVSSGDLYFHTSMILLYINAQCMYNFMDFPLRMVKTVVGVEYRRFCPNMEYI